MNILEVTETDSLQGKKLVPERRRGEEGGGGGVRKGKRREGKGRRDEERKVLTINICISE